MSACGGSPDNTIDITYDYCAPLVIAPAVEATAAERASVAEAIAMWNALGMTSLSIESEDALLADAPRVPIHFREAAPAFYGLYEDELGELVINNGFTNDRSRTITIAHELGHVFGLIHVEAHPSVMNPANLNTEPNAADAASLRALATCD